MWFRRALLAVFLLAAFLTTTAQPDSQDQLLKRTGEWLHASSTGDRAVLNQIMDAKFIATTPSGDVLDKERLVPNDSDHPVQKLPPMELDGPLVRIYGDTGVLMSRLKPAGGAGPSMNGTFVYTKEANAWKLVAMHLSGQK